MQRLSVRLWCRRCRLPTPLHPSPRTDWPTHIRPHHFARQTIAEPKQAMAGSDCSQAAPIASFPSNRSLTHPDRLPPVARSARAHCLQDSTEPQHLADTRLHIWWHTARPDRRARPQSPAPLDHSMSSIRHRQTRFDSNNRHMSRRRHKS